MTIRIDLDGPADFTGWRDAARRLAQAGIAPAEVIWRTGQHAGDLFADAPPSAAVPPPMNGKVLTAPRRFIDVAELAVCHRDPERFALLYRLLCRIQDAPRLLDLTIDEDVFRIEAMAKSVRRDRHKMTAFVRFKEVAADDGPAYVAWFEPEHHILALTAPFFVDRFASMRWSIITPGISAFWDREALAFGPGGTRADVPPDEAGDDLWRTYYANIFNPARLKIDAMKREMPVKYWKNLPESQLIAPLIRAARARRPPW